MPADGDTRHAPADLHGRPPARGPAHLRSATYDAVVVGTSLNALLAAADLGGNGWRVAVVGEFTGSTEMGLDHLTLPGHVHDSFTLWHLHFLASEAYPAMAADLARHGLEYVTSPGPLSAVVGDTGTLVAHRDPGTTSAGFADPRDSAAYVGLLRGVERLRHDVMLGLGAGLGQRELFAVDGVGLRVAASTGEPEVGRAAAMSGAELFADRFSGDEVARLWLPWLSALGLRPDDVLGGLALPATMLALHENGLPAVRGGAARFSTALIRLLRERGVDLFLGSFADRIEVSHRRVVAVHVDGVRLEALGSVLAATDAGRLHEQLLGETWPSPVVLAPAGSSSPSGRGGAPVAHPELGDLPDVVQLEAHLALQASIPWSDPVLRETPVVHVERPGTTPLTIGQPTVLDPGRAPRGRATSWIRATVPLNEAAEPASALRRQLGLVDRHAPGLDRCLAAWRVGTKPAVGAGRFLAGAGSDHPATGRYRVVSDWAPGVGAVYKTGVGGLYHLGAFRHPTLRLGDEALAGGARRLPLVSRVPTA